MFLLNQIKSIAAYFVTNQSAEGVRVKLSWGEGTGVVDGVEG